jgi:hypothetical protein
VNNTRLVILVHNIKEDEMGKACSTLRMKGTQNLVGRKWRRWGDNIKIDTNKIYLEDVDRIHLRDLVNTVINLRVL